jgi:hypothetical protein
MTLRIQAMFLAAFVIAYAMLLTTLASAEGQSAARDRASAEAQ